MSSVSSQKSGKKSAQSKPTRAWLACGLCGLSFISENGQSLSEHVCVPNSNAIKPQHLTESYFLNSKCSFASLNLIEHPKDIHKDLQISKDYTFDFAYLNPSTMRLCSLELGDSVLVSLPSQKTACCFTCWPLNQLDPVQIALNKPYSLLNGFGIDQNVLVEKLNRSERMPACQLTLELAKNFCNSTLGAAQGNNNEHDDTELILQFMLEVYLGKLVSASQLLYSVYMGQRLVFKLVNVLCNNNNSAVNSLDQEMAGLSLESSAKVYAIDSRTKFSLTSQRAGENEQETTKRNVFFRDLGGMEKEIELVREVFIDPFKFCSIYKQVGVELSKGVILYGPSGCGKTMLAKAVLNECQCNSIQLNMSQIYSRNSAESEAKLRQAFEEACAKAPCVLFIDELDAICGGKRESTSQELDRRIVSLFSSLLDNSKSNQVLFLCTTNKIDTIDVSLRRPGRLDKEIEIPIPNRLARHAILKAQLDKLKHKVTAEQLLEISQSCHGYVGADLQMLAQEAGLACVKRATVTTTSITKGNNSDTHKSTNYLIEYQDLVLALHKTKPSAMREITFDIPAVQWSQIGGQHDLKKKLQQAVIWPIKYAESFRRLSIKPPRGLLMYGPPGCSKTMIAKALATETGLNFIAVKGPELFSKWVGESERMVREIFRKARQAAPAIIFFDEIDAVAMERSSSANKSNNVGDRVLAQLLNEMDGVESLTDVTVVAATNRPDMIDKALMRPGRLDRIVYVRLPDEATRQEIFELRLKTIPVMSEEVSVAELVARTKGYSGAEIVAVCNEAAFLALEGDINVARVSWWCFEQALVMVQPRTSRETIEYFDNFSFK